MMVGGGTELTGPEEDWMWGGLQGVWLTSVSFFATTTILLTVYQTFPGDWANAVTLRSHWSTRMELGELSVSEEEYSRHVNQSQAHSGSDVASWDAAQQLTKLGLKDLMGPEVAPSRSTTFFSFYIKRSDSLNKINVKVSFLMPFVSGLSQ